MNSVPKRYRLIPGVVVVLLLSACGAGSPTSTPDTGGSEPASSEGSSGGSVLEGKSLVFITYGNESEYQIAAGEWFKQFAEEEGAEVSVIDGAFDPLVQVEAMNDAIASGADAILIQPFDTATIVEPTQTAREAGIVVGIVGTVPDPAAVVPAVGTFNDESLVKEAAADAVAWLQENKPGEPARLVLFDIPASRVCHDWRMVAFRDEVVAQMGDENVEEVYFDLVDHTLDVVVQKMQDIIQSGDSFNMFSACGGTGAVGGLDALTAADMAVAVDGVPQDIWVLSIDATPAELEYLVDPDVSLVQTIALTPKNNAQVHLDTLKQIFAGDIDPDSDFVVAAPGLTVHKEDGCEAISAALADQYAVLPSYSPLEC